MNSLFHITFVVIFVIFWGIRMAYQKKANDLGGEAEFKEGQQHERIRRIVGIPFMLLFVAFMIRPSILAWATFPIPEWAQWLGLALGVISISLIWWVQWALDINFQTRLHVREAHTLVTHGPYRWVRHPMYTVLYLHLFAILLLTANWLIAGTLLLMQTIIIALRLKNEEAAMVAKFGDKYREYMKQTGRFLPKLSL
jgi:protein-S-isoprenylcysteine O-methyltransferase Ste14